jgi:ubiquinone biosynthesis protein
MKTGESQPGILAPLPRRAFLTPRAGESVPPQMRTVAFSAGRLRPLLRLFVWLGMLLRFGAGVLADALRRANTTEQRARRLRRVFEQTGGTAIKIGQHLALRLDLLPWEYGNELSAMRDRVAPFPAARAIAMVERSTGQPLAENFARFDTDPVVSSSVACIYQAILPGGERVVVKVRRPGAGERFMADLKVFDWLLGLLELFTILRPGYTRSMRRELRDSLVEELDFVQEARYMDLFRRAAKKSGKRFFTAPRVRFELSGEDVFVQEFVAGIWLWELVAAVERKDEGVLALARGLDIDPAQIARRLTWINYWAWHEQFFFRADPHPDRIIVGEGGRLTFIDFGSVGTIDRAKRHALQQNLYYAWKQDPLNMARASLALLEPLPAVDANELTKELEACNWQMLFGFEMRSTEQELSNRTSAPQWIGLVRVARRFGIVIDFHVLRLLRGSVMYDTLAVRLSPRINVIREYRRFVKYHAARARHRVRRRLVRNASGYPGTPGLYLHLEQLANTGESLFFRLRHALSIPRANFSALMGKGSYLLYTSIRLAAELVVFMTLMMGLAALAEHFATGQWLDPRHAFDRVLGMAAFQLVAVALVVLNARRVLFRMDDRVAR